MDIWLVNIKRGSKVGTKFQLFFIKEKIKKIYAFYSISYKNFETNFSVSKQIFR